MRSKRKSKEDVAWSIFGSDIGDIDADFPCTLENVVHLNGRLYITHTHACFFSNFFGIENRWKIGYQSVESLVKSQAPFWEPTMVLITAERQYIFRGFQNRDMAFEVVTARLREWRQVNRPESWRHLVLQAVEDLEGEGDPGPLHSNTTTPIGSGTNLADLNRERDGSESAGTVRHQRSSSSILLQVAHGELPLTPFPMDDTNEETIVVGDACQITVAKDNGLSAQQKLNSKNEEQAPARGLKTEGSGLFVIEDMDESDKSGFGEEVGKPQKGRERTASKERELAELRRNLTNAPNVFKDLKVKLDLPTVPEDQKNQLKATIELDEDDSSSDQDGPPLSFEEAVKVTKLKNAVRVPLHSTDNYLQKGKNSNSGKNQDNKKNAQTKCWSIPVAFSEFFNLVLADSALFGLPAYRLQFGVWDMALSPWDLVQSKKVHGQKKQISVLTREMHYCSALQWAFGLYQASVIEEHTCWLYGKDGIIFQIRRKFGQIPAKEGFCVEETWVVRPGLKPQKSCDVTASMQVTFTQYILWGPYIEHKARNDAHDFHRCFLRWIEDFIDKPITSPHKKLRNKRSGVENEKNQQDSKVFDGKWLPRFSKAFALLPYLLMLLMWFLGPKTTPISIPLADLKAEHMPQVLRSSPTWEITDDFEFTYLNISEVETSLRLMKHTARSVLSTTSGLKLNLKDTVENQLLELKIIKQQCEDISREVSVLFDDLFSTSD